MKSIKPLTAAQRAMVEESLPVARWVARRYIKGNDSISGLETEDLQQEAYLALCKAAASYNGQDARFSTYAVTVIRNHLLDYCRAIYMRNLKFPTLSLNAPCAERDSGDIIGEAIAGVDGCFEDELLSRAWVTTFLARRKECYQGCAGLGIEALERKVLDGSGVTELAEKHGVRPNLLGAWISKAAQKIREDITISEYAALSVENGGSVS